MNNWNNVIESISEIMDLQEILETKINNPLFIDITIRNKQDKKAFNNAVLEQKLKNTPYQMIILSKINELSLHLDLQSIYENMPKEIEAANRYVLELKEKYQLAIKCLELITDIEYLSTVEYEGNFKDNEYTKKIIKESEYFIKFCPTDYEIFENMIDKMLKDYYHSLTTKEKSNLLIQEFSLSYEKNSFDFFSTIKIVANLKNGKSMDDNITSYGYYKNFIKIAQFLLLNKMSLQEIYNEFKVIYENEFKKEKKKQV